MKRIAKSLTEYVGNTPLLELVNYSSSQSLNATILAKLEYFNPAGSVKDRAAKMMIEEAEKSGKLVKGATIIEPTSGNTGVGIAFVAACKGYKVIFTMPETMSLERRILLKALGAEVVLTPGAEGMAGAVKEAERLNRQIAGSVIMRQFDNPANPLAHIATANEIWRDTEGTIDIFVAGVGTGGTVSGTGKRLKALSPDVKVVAVEPAESPLLSQGVAAPHGIQGIGANFVPLNYDASVVDEVITIATDDAISTSRMLAQREGLLVGISSGAAVAAARILALRKENRGKTIVALLPDTGERYLSTPLFAD